MFDGLIQLVVEIINEMFNALGILLYNLLPNQLDMLENTEFNIYLFSDTGWFSPSISLIDIFAITMITLMFIFLIRLLWKGTKKFISMVFGVFKV